jgi:ABC-type multidrug transport system ATPase subunit
VIRFDSVVKQYGAHRAVDGLSLEVAGGEVVALIGPNGSGKTTSLKAAAGLLRPTAGRVLVGDPGRSVLEPAARGGLSFLPQKVAFPDALTGGEVLELYRRLRRVPRERAADVLRTAALNGAAGAQVSTYSGGMVQRLGLAVAALPDASAYLLDEPTSSLDADGIRVFHELVERWRERGAAIVFSTHRFGDVERLADRVAVLVRGRPAWCGSARAMSDLLAAHGRLRLRVRNGGPDLLAHVVPIAAGARWDGRELVVRGSAAVRAEALSAVQRAGAEVLALSAEEGRVEELYQRLEREAAA